MGLAAIFACGTTAPQLALAAGSATVKVNGTPVQSEAVIIHDQVYVPLREVGEAMGATVSWDQNQKTANVTANTAPSDKNIPKVLERVNPFVVGIIGVFNSDASVSYKSQYLDGIANGTGIVISADGTILTNAHVVKDLKSIVVVMYDGKTYEGKLIAIDEFSDLATVKIDKTDLAVAKFANNNDIYTGQDVLAIGTPLSMSFRNTVSFGIISGVNRGMGSNYRLIQTDAAINPGNSGGPLVNMKGEVIGINSSKFVGPSIEGMGFSIPVDTVQYVLNHFNTYGKVMRPEIGATFEEDTISKLGLVSNGGITISTFQDTSPLKAAGAAVGDRIIAINGQSVNSIIDFNELMKSFLPDNEIKVKIKGKEAELTVKLK